MTSNTDIPIIRKSDETFTLLNQIEDMIREHAYRIFHDRGPTEGDALSDWLNAESEVLSGIDLQLTEDDCNVVIEGPVEGFLPDEIETRIKNGTLEIAGLHTEQGDSGESEGATKTSKQISFFRAFTLPDSLDTDNMEVSLECGKLTARIPKLLH